ncbi:hypothetical protein [Pandoravirus japonicus]|uniref:Uncharacterized protein n=1 Tax=Pandoravirus japonicus TaxID=2823154 RepID=A0A811BSY5_9VIRU|nr:hypothetical protein [Pandoravirus japonicus]
MRGGGDLALRGNADFFFFFCFRPSNFFSKARADPAQSVPFFFFAAGRHRSSVAAAVWRPPRGFFPCLKQTPRSAVIDRLPETD